MNDSGTGQPPALRRALTTPLVVLYGLGVTVGAGIYVLVGATAASAGSFAPVAFLVAALVVAFTALSYAELATRYPVSAGEAAYVEAGLRSARLATVVGLLVAASGMVSAAAVAIGTASYLQALIGLPKPVLLGLIVVVMGLTAIWGIVQSVAIAAVITVIEIGGLGLVILWGTLFAEPSGLTAVDFVPPVWGPHWIGIGAASLLAFFAFVGFEDMANVAEEVKDPVRTLPRAIVLTLLLASGLYLATTVAVLLSVPMAELVVSDAPLALVFEGAPGAVQRVFAFVAVVATLNGVLIQMIMSSRVLFGLARRDQLPRFLAKVSARTQTPVHATLCVVAVVLTLALLLPIDALAERTSQLVLCVFVLVNVALIRLKRAGPSDTPHFSVPRAVPVLGLLSALGLLAASAL